MRIHEDGLQDHLVSPTTMFYNGYNGGKMNKSMNMYTNNLEASSNFIDSRYNSTSLAPMVKPRKWQTGLSDKLMGKEKYKYNEYKKNEKIRRCLERERIKSRIGYRLNLQNMKILEQMKRKKANHRKSNSYFASSYQGSVDLHQMTNTNFFQQNSDGTMSLTEEGRQMVLRKSAFPKSVMQESFTSE